MDEDDLRHEVCQIKKIPGLYISDWVGAASVNEANILGITHILSVLSDQELDAYGPEPLKGVELRHLNIGDDSISNISQYLTSECDWLDDILGQQDAAVIVHCQQGVSRSVAVVVAYLIRKLGLTFDEALEEVSNSRSIVNLNPSFVGQLREWESTVIVNRRTPKLNTSSMPESNLPSHKIARSVNVITPVDIIDFVEGER